MFCILRLSLYLVPTVGFYPDHLLLFLVPIWCMCIVFWW